MNTLQETAPDPIRCTHINRRRKARKVTPLRCWFSDLFGRSSHQHVLAERSEVAAAVTVTSARPSLYIPPTHLNMEGPSFYHPHRVSLLSLHPVSIYRATNRLACWRHALRGPVIAYLVYGWRGITITITKKASISGSELKNFEIRISMILSNPL